MPTRTRTRDDSYYANLTYKWEGNGFATLNPGPYMRQIRIGGVYETIDDVWLARKSWEEKYTDVKPCSHVKLTYTGIPYQDWYGDNGLLIKMVDSGCPFRPDVMLGMLPTVSEGLRSGLCEEAFNSFSTQFPETFSVAEFAQGLGELDALIPSFSGKLVNDLASLKLGNDFGWQSMLSDINTFSNLVKSLEDRLSWLRKTYGKPTKLAFMRRDVLSPGSAPDVVDYPVRGWRVRYQLHSYKTDFRAGATLLQELEHLNDAIGYLRALSGASGFSNPLKSFWNLVPFSFIVDYFLPISRRLDTFKLQAATEKWDLSKISHSFRTDVVWKIYQENPDLVNGTYQQQFLGFVTGVLYDRRVGLPVTWDAFLHPTSPLSAGQLTLLGALAAANS